jgi:hypothetical protein
MERAKLVLEWIVANWELCAAIGAGLISILNAVSKHWSTRTGLTKWLSWVTEMLSIITSSGTRTRLVWVLGKIKLPLQSVPPKGGPTIPPVTILMIAGILIASCATTPKQAILRAASATIAATDAAGKIIMARYGEKCLSAAKACPKKPAECPALDACQASRHRAVAVLKGAFDGSVGLLELVPLLED